MAIEEAHFQWGIFRMQLVNLGMIERSESSIRTFEGHLPEFLDQIMAGLRESEARLWRYKGNAAEWTDSHAMIVAGKVLWDEDRRERLLVADLEYDFRAALQEVRDQLVSGDQTPDETRASMRKEMESFDSRLADRYGWLQKQAVASGLVKQKQIDKVRVRAEKRLGTVVRGALP